MVIMRHADKDVRTASYACLRHVNGEVVCKQHMYAAPAAHEALLTQVKRQSERDPELAGMEAEHAKAPQDSLARMQLSFGLGKANDDLKDYPRAFDYFAEGNAIRRKGINYDTVRESLRRQNLMMKLLQYKVKPRKVSDEEVAAAYSAITRARASPVGGDVSSSPVNRPRSSTPRWPATMSSNSGRRGSTTKSRAPVMSRVR